MSERILEVDYTNHKGERRVRRILPVGQIFFGSNLWHTQEQWLINAIDLEDPTEPTKTFALKGINGSNSDQRITDLLTANNALLEENRDLKAQIATLQAQLTPNQEQAAPAPAVTLTTGPVPTDPATTQAPAAADPAPVAQPTPAPAPEAAPTPAPEAPASASAPQPVAAAADPAPAPVAATPVGAAPAEAQAPVTEAQPS